YIMYVNAAGFLQFVYYGAKIDNADYLTQEYAKTLAPEPDGFNIDGAFNGMPSEYAFFGKGDYRAPTAVFVREDGFRASRFIYKSHKVKSGAPEIKGLPHVRKGGKTLSVVLKDQLSDMEITLNYTVLDDSDVLIRNAVLHNCGKQNVRVTKAFSMCLELPDSQFDIMRLHGRWAQERMPEITPLGHGTVRIESSQACSSHEMNPFAALMRKACTETEGECYGINLIYSGSWAITSEVHINGSLRLQAGINDLNFEWKLGADEQFITPQAALCYSATGLGGMSREFADFYRNYIINPNKVYEQRPIVINNWEATYFNFDRDKLFDIIDAAAPLGIDTFVLDDGWFGKRDDDKSGLGDWVVNEKKLVGGLKAVADKCAQKGMKFGLWFEPEMICEDSDLYRAHPDFAIGKRGVTPSRARNQLVLDFSRQDVVDHIFDSVSKILKSCNISYVKWDMNRRMTEFYSEYLPSDRQGEIAHRYILGVYDLAERLTSEFPDIFFEGCAGGGGRFDGGMLYYFPQIWTSDDTDAYERTKIQYGTSMCYPVSAMSCHVSACPNHQTQRITPLATRGAIASLGATGYELDLTKLGDEEKEEIKRQIVNYKNIDELVLRGDLYRLSSPFNSNYFCEMIVAKDKSQAYVVGERIHGVPCDFNQIVKLKGLDHKKRYTVKELGITASGKTLENAGLLFPKLPDYGSWVWNIVESK
ncbi:MAG: alpha-galactosidase, partial [Clostridiales bacterium]|nr:alpha-galactosidase [Clostridiales bacterium]